MGWRCWAGGLCLIIIKCHWAKINGWGAERLKDYIAKCSPQAHKLIVRKSVRAIVMSPLDYRHWQITWATQWQTGYLAARMWVVACKDATAPHRRCRHFYSFGCYCWPCCCCRRVCKPCYYNNVQSESEVEHWEKSSYTFRQLFNSFWGTSKWFIHLYISQL